MEIKADVKARLTCDSKHLGGVIKEMAKMELKKIIIIGGVVIFTTFLIQLPAILQAL